MLLKLLGTGLLGFVGYRYFVRHQDGDHAAFASGQPKGSHMDVRDAGPNAMRDGSGREWTETDEDLDESFPASDPPGGY
ncbi:hypothetical protein [Croceicoccus gelatinilyticus]|uniref:hypothetical protein n=1 Tax=Croceicoccus gelatinilyticus TaxID=2835536 RepID=UPI001BCF6791|nr:hypothetical protein [Croceicoccus gelatinilyticus]MBS7668133.1 hypothetical protein [Croceicoccus gelatinilyticus]